MDSSNGSQASQPSTALLTFILLMVPMLWGFGYPLIRASMGEIGAFQFLVYRFGIALIPLLIVFRRSLKGLPLSVWRNGVVLGMTLATAYAALNLGLTYTTTVKAGFIMGFRVVLIPLLALTLLRLPTSGRTWAATLISAAGVGVIFLSTGTDLLTINRGDAIMLLTALAFAVHVLLIGRLLTAENMGALIVIQAGVVTVVGALFIGALEGLTLPHSPLHWFHLGATGLLSTALALWLQNRYQPMVSPGKAGIIYSSEPLFAGLFGFLYLGEQLAGAQWLGALLILAAMILAQWPELKSFFASISK